MELLCGSGDDFRDFGVTPALGVLWAVLRPQGGPRQPQDSPGEPKRARDSPQGAPRGSQRLSVSSLGALLELSWGSLEQSPCSANLSFTEAKPRCAKIEDFDYEISCEVKCQKTIEFLFKNVHRSHPRAPKCIVRTHFSSFKTS